jgi:hypothetical protein
MELHLKSLASPINSLSSFVALHMRTEISGRFFCFPLLTHTKLSKASIKLHSAQRRPPEQHKGLH